ncbi:MAG: 50S ribosomal protein L10 [Candidatus Palauibacterales bacterium]|nr:50S ribosomal protein L10 [Candidatus Palauibacterales bacterium]
MKREEKKQVTEELTESFRESGTIYLTDFTGLSVGEMTEFRDRLAEEGVRYRVVKNTLALRALSDSDLPDIADHFSGPTGLVLGDEDPVAPAKVLTEFADEHDDRPTLKVGVVESRVVEPAEIEDMAELPSREELLAGIAGSLTASIGGIAGILNRIIGDIGDIAHRAAEERESGSEG